MSSSNWGPAKSLARVGVVSTLLHAAGCISASLASDTGPRPVGHHWSVEPLQLAHVGEQVRFDFVLTNWRGRLVNPTGIADYCVAHVGSQRIEVEPQPNGHFRFEHAFDSAREGDEVTVTAEAYRQRGGRDFIYVQGRWLSSRSPYEFADSRVAGDALTLRFSQTDIELSLVRPPDELEPDTGVLRIRRSDGAVDSVYIDRPQRPGFTLTGPDPDGYYHVRYKPTGSQFNPVGTTTVEFQVYDLSGQRHRVEKQLPTP